MGPTYDPVVRPHVERSHFIVAQHYGLVPTAHARGVDLNTKELPLHSYLAILVAGSSQPTSSISNTRMP